MAGHENVLTDCATNNADVYGSSEDGGDESNTEYAESAVIKAKTAGKLTLKGNGTYNVVASDDGINAAGDGETSNDTVNPGGRPGRPGSTSGSSTTSNAYNINISGGNTEASTEATTEDKTGGNTDGTEAKPGENAASLKQGNIVTDPTTGFSYKVKTVTDTKITVICIGFGDGEKKSKVPKKKVKAYKKLFAKKTGFKSTMKLKK